METLVIGHRNPDMDSICSALAYAQLKRQQGWSNVTAGRAGTLNARIEFVLKKFGVGEPVHVTDVTPQVRDVMARRVITARAETTISEAIMAIDEFDLRGLPVVDADGHCLGLISAHKITHALFPSRGEMAHARRVTARLSDIFKTFDGQVQVNPVPANEGVQEYWLTVAAISPETFAERLAQRDRERLVVFVGDRVDIQKLCIDHKVRAIVVIGGLSMSPWYLDAAQAAGVTVVYAAADAASTVLMARGALRVGEALEREFMSFAPETTLESARTRASNHPSTIFPVLDAARRVVGVVTKSDFIRPIRRQLILVDHNELTQAVQGADKVPVIEVLDHHRLGGFSSETPVLFWNNPVGSTSTIVTLCYEQAGIEIPPAIAGLLMAGLISDTLNLTSPTTTDVDRRVLPKLAGLAGIGADQLAQEIFAIGSPLLTLTPDAVVTADCKEFEEQGRRFSVAQIEELSFEPFHERREAVAAALAEYRRKRDLDFSALLVTDINTQDSLFLLDGAEKLREQIHYSPAGPGVWLMPGVVSRKKQLLPWLLQALAALGR
ncbi:MAG: putative manganese-dependent inorganic diphosphatase [Verrucomicrobia bacterium]|nr:putative manganese-dependent inorganic diphosphatase [Verrucomicrobiota bacterium]